MDETGERLSAAGWRVVLLASLGGALEFYDFVIFGVFARDIAQAVFPAESPIVSLMASFGAFAAGYVARPIGGIVLSHYGDRDGRRRGFCGRCSSCLPRRSAWDSFRSTRDGARPRAP
jgi:MFS family permease